MSNNSQSRGYCHCIDKHYNTALTVDALKLRDTFDKYTLIIPGDANFREFKWSLLFVQHIVITLFDPCANVNASANACLLYRPKGNVS